MPPRQLALALPLPASRQDRVRLTPTGLEIRGALEQPEWLKVGETLRQLERATLWAIGDWLAYGLARKYGDLRRIADAQGWEYETLHGALYVSSRVEFGIRIPNLGWHHHRLVAPLSAEEQREWLRQASTEQWHVQDLRNALRNRRREEAIARAGPLPEGRFAVLYADPPWEFNNSGFEQSAAAHYATMPTPEIAALAVPVAPDAVVFLWVPNSLLPDGLSVLTAWGFDYKTFFVWVKDRAPGIGWYCQTHHETLLFGLRGEPPPPKQKPRSVMAASVGEHSAKPLEWYELIESMYGGPYLELFARSRREQWKSWGSDLPGSIHLDRRD